MTARLGITVALLMAGWGSVNAVGKPKILYEEDPTLLTSSIEIVVRTGALQDPKGKGGLSSLLADLMLRGTKKRGRDQFQDEIERLGGTLSGSASHDGLYFTGEVIKENTLPFLELVEEFLIQPALTKKEFDDLKKETLNSIAHIKNVNTRLGGLALRREVFKGTALETPVSGTLSSVGKITLKDCEERYKGALTRGNMFFAFATPLKAGAITERLGKIWEKLPEGESPKVASITPVVPKEPTLIVVNKPKTSTGSLLLGQAGISAQDPDRYRLAIGDFGFGGEPLVSRLFKIVRGELGWTYSVGTTYSAMGPLTSQQGLFMMYSTPSVEFSVKALFKMMSMWKEYLTSGLKGEEITLGKESLVNSYPFNFDSATKRLSQRVWSELNDVPILSPEDYAKTLGAIDNKAVVDSLGKHHSASGWVVTIVADAGVLKKQLEDEQKDIPPAQRIKITKTITPEAVIQ